MGKKGKAASITFEWCFVYKKKKFFPSLNRNILSHNCFRFGLYILQTLLEMLRISTLAACLCRSILFTRRMVELNLLIKRPNAVHTLGDIRF